MIKVPFVKYTSYGNNFVIVDETRGNILSEAQKSAFAFQATSTHFGIGCDNLLVLQRCDQATLNEINRERNYWECPPDASVADYIFRMFEPNGDEAFSCGNGLISIADFLKQNYGLDTARIITEVPLEEPKVLTLRSDSRSGDSTVCLGVPRRVPDSVASSMIRNPIDDSIDLIEKIQIRFRAHDLQAYTNTPELTMSGYMVFTGEPHMVIFPEESFSNAELVKPLFAGSTSKSGGKVVKRRLSIGSWLVRRIGTFLNDQFQGYFPAGINVNFARVHDDGESVEYRCFERGIFRETLACGTGAIAVAVVAAHLQKVQGPEVKILPHLCRWHDGDAYMRAVTESNGEWSLSGNPRMLVDGNFMLDPETSEAEAGTDLSDTMEVIRMEGQLVVRPRLAYAS